MRKKVIRFCAISGILLAQCAADKTSMYYIPADLKGEKRDKVLANLETGRKLYQAHCAECHGIYSKGKRDVPNFNNQQIDNYSAWTIKRDARSHAVAANMSSDQLNDVFMFLRLLKRKAVRDSATAAK